MNKKTSNAIIWISIVMAVPAWVCLPVKAQGTLTETSLATYIGNLKPKIPGAGTESFQEPPQADLDAFGVAMHNLLEGRVPLALTQLDAVNYDLNYLNDTVYSRQYLIAEERAAGFKGLGTFMVSVSYGRNIVLEAPHPWFDTNTMEESRLILQEIDARGLFVSGTHRCANALASSCSGTTSACSGVSEPYRVSDAAHFTRNFLQMAHQSTLNLNPRPLVMNIHGMASEPTDIEISDGTKMIAPAGAAVNRLRNALVARGVDVKSCNLAADDPASLNLCGTTNVQGRLSNNSPEPCQTAASSASGFFLHIEQKIAIRNNPSDLIAALQEVFPLTVFLPLVVRPD